MCYRYPCHCGHRVKVSKILQLDATIVNVGLSHGFPASLSDSLKFMLILTRKSGETIRIGDSIAVTVLEIKGNQIRLGIAAPRDVAVDREEVAMRKKAEQDTRQDTK